VDELKVNLDTIILDVFADEVRAFAPIRTFESIAVRRGQLGFHYGLGTAGDGCIGHLQTDAVHVGILVGLSSAGTNNHPMNLGGRRNNDARTRGTQLE